MAFDSSDRAVGVIVGLQRDPGEAGGCTLDSPDLGLPLAKVTPVRPTVSVSELCGLSHHMEDPHVGNFAEYCLFLGHG